MTTPVPSLPQADAAAAAADSEREAHLRRLAAVGALAPVFTHDLNNCLGSLVAGLHLLGMRIADPAMKARVVTIADAANRAIAAAHAFSALAEERGTLIDVHAMIPQLARRGDLPPLSAELLARRAQVQGDAAAIAAALSALITLVGRNAGFSGTVRIDTANRDFVSDRLPSQRQDAGPSVPTGSGEIWLRLAISGTGAPLSEIRRRIIEAPLSVLPGDREGMMLAGAVAAVKRCHGAVVVPVESEGVALWVFLPLAEPSPRGV